MSTTQRILVGVDLAPRGKSLTPGSQKALDQGLWAAQAWGARVGLVHSVHEDGYTEPFGTHEIVHRGLSDAGRATLEAAAEALRAGGVECDLRIVEERLWVALIHEVQRGRGELVVVGKRNQEQAEGRKLGSIAVKLLRKCPAPVWVVKPEHDLSHKLILAATDLTRVGDAAVHWAARIAAKQECELHVVHAYQIPFALQMESANLTEEEFAEEIERIRAAAMEEIQECIAQSGESVEPQIHIGKNAPSVAIREAVEHLHPDLLVMGTISRGGIAGFLLGNTAEKLLGHLDCSLVGIKPHDFITPIQPPP